MALMIGVALIILCFVGLVTSHTMGGFLNILMMVSALVILSVVVRGNKKG